MAGDAELRRRAQELLQKHRVKEICEALLDNRNRLEPSDEVDITTNPDLGGLEPAAHGIELLYEDHSIVIATSDFRLASKSDCKEEYATFFLYVDGQLVLETDVLRVLGERSSNCSISTGPESIMSLHAGPWLDLLATAYDKLQSTRQKKQREPQGQAPADEPARIELGDY